MRMVQNGITENKNEVALYRHAPKFVPAGQSTQMIIGATPEHDYQIVSIAENLYNKFDLKRVFYSAFVNVTHSSNLPSLPGGPPLLREHRLYQADWLLRYYHFKADELLSPERPDFNIFLDPKCDWATGISNVFRWRLTAPTTTRFYACPASATNLPPASSRHAAAVHLTFLTLRRSALS